MYSRRRAIRCNAPCPWWSCDGRSRRATCRQPADRRTARAAGGGVRQTPSAGPCARRPRPVWLLSVD